MLVESVGSANREQQKWPWLRLQEGVVVPHLTEGAAQFPAPSQVWKMSSSPGLVKVIFPHDHG